MMIKITPNEHLSLSRYIQEISGIVLDKSKSYLIEGRLAPLLDEYNCSNYSELYFKAKNSSDKVISTKIIDAISTNETSFFRDETPFELLKQFILPKLLEKKADEYFYINKNLDIWCSACSTGQEIYSLGMVLDEISVSYNEYDIKILGTDISDLAIQRASYGSYNKTEIDRGLSAERLGKYFHPYGSYWRVNDEIRAFAAFERLNLLRPLVHLGRFDLILCRNVAIYFSHENRKYLFNQIADRLKPHGVLIIGSTESLTGLDDRFIRRQYKSAVYYEVINTNEFSELARQRGEE
ncbi:CheR family methyltransferase [Spirochaetota bacterium]